VNSPIISTGISEYAAISLSDDRAERIEAPGSRNRDARGAIAGVLLGAGCWGAILVVVGFIKL
jgi:hypothetical protein